MLAKSKAAAHLLPLAQALMEQLLDCATLQSQSSGICRINQATQVLSCSIQIWLLCVPAK